MNSCGRGSTLLQDQVSGLCRESLRRQSKRLEQSRLDRLVAQAGCSLFAGMGVVVFSGTRKMGGFPFGFLLKPAKKGTSFEDSAVNIPYRRTAHPRAIACLGLPLSCPWAVPECCAVAGVGGPAEEERGPWAANEMWLWAPGFKHKGCERCSGDELS